MKDYNPTMIQEDFNVGEQMKFLFRLPNSTFGMLIGKIISNNKLTLDGIPFIEVDFDSHVKKYVTNRIS